MQLQRASSVDEIPGDSLLLAGGTELVPLVRNRLVQGESLVDIRGVVPRGIDGTRIGAGATLGPRSIVLPGLM